jgi:hypothetical protein
MRGVRELNQRELFGMFDGQRSKENDIDQVTHRGIRADAEAQNENCGQ